VSPYVPIIAALIAAFAGLAGIMTGARLTREHARRAQAERLLVEALNDAVAAIASVAGGAGQDAQRLYAAAVSRIALHGSPSVVAAFRRFQDDATTTTDEGRARLLSAVHAARGELGHASASNEDLTILLFGSGPVDVHSWAQGVEQVGESVIAFEPAGAMPGQDDELDRLVELAENAPATAVVTSFALIHRELERIARANGLPADGTPTAALADIAERAGLVTKETVSAVRGLVALRNFAVHAQSDTEVTPSRAREYVALVQAVLFALSRRPRRET